MRREHFEHVVAAAAKLQSLEVDIYPATEPDKADLIDGALGDGSPFHRAFGYYGHGVGPDTAKAPAGWRERLVRVEVPPRLNSPRRPIAWCLEPHDLVLAKCAAGRERDWQYARTALAADLVDVAVLLARVRSLPISGDHQQHLRGLLIALDGR